METGRLGELIVRWKRDDPVEANPLQSYPKARCLAGLVIRGKAVLLLNCHLLLLLCATGPAIGSALPVSAGYQVVAGAMIGTRADARRSS
jgi:hypothetical protein